MTFNFFLSCCLLLYGTISQERALTRTHAHIHSCILRQIIFFLFYCLAFFFCFNHTNAVVRENATECLFTKKHLNVSMLKSSLLHVSRLMFISVGFYFFSFLQYYIINMIIVFFLCFFFSEMLIASHCFIFLSIVIDFFFTLFNAL